MNQDGLFHNKKMYPISNDVELTGDQTISNDVEMMDSEDFPINTILSQCFVCAEYIVGEHEFQ